MAHARPERFCTFTQVGDSWPVVRARMKRVRHRVAELGYRWEWVWQVERNPAGTGHHVHCWQRGSYVPQSQLVAIASREGLGRVVDIRAWHRGEERATAYAMKAITYTFKDAAGDVDAASFLAMNGHRLSHQSRGWWTAGGARDQEAAALRDLLGVRSEEWHVVKKGQATAWIRATGARPVLSPISTRMAAKTSGTSTTMTAKTSIRTG